MKHFFETSSNYGTIKYAFPSAYKCECGKVLFANDHNIDTIVQNHTKDQTIKCNTIVCSCGRAHRVEYTETRAVIISTAHDLLIEYDATVSATSEIVGTPIHIDEVHVSTDRKNRPSQIKTLREYDLETVLDLASVGCFNNNSLLDNIGFTLVLMFSLLKTICKDVGSIIEDIFDSDIVLVILAVLIAIGIIGGIIALNVFALSDTANPLLICFTGLVDVFIFFIFVILPAGASR